MIEQEQVLILREIRDLLRPIAHHHQAEYDAWLAGQRKQWVAEVKAAVDASTARRKAWALADGSRTQRDISKQSGLDEGSTSKFFKQLRGLGAVEGDVPNRTVEV